MRFGFALLLAWTSAFFAPAALAATPDDIYLEAYEWIQEADQFTAANQPELARQRYAQAEENLKKLRNAYPNYNKAAVDFRLEFIAEKLKGLPPPKAEPGTRAADRPAAAPTRPAAPGEQIKALNERIAQLESDNETLRAKLKEALAPKPAAIDPGEFAKARERIDQLEKEKELLKVSLAQAVAKQPQAADLEMLKQTKAELEIARKRELENVATIATITRENQTLRLELVKAKAGEGEISALRSKAAQFERAQSDWQKQRAELEAKLAAAAKPATENARVKELEKERDSLLRRLEEARKELAEVKSQRPNASGGGVNEQLASLRARLEVYEARKVPFTKEELALMDKGAPKLAVEEPKPARPRELPPGAGVLVAQAQAAFAGRRYAEAEEKYKQVLKMDEENPASLANLAAIQLELQKLEEAEANLDKANRINPGDAYTLSLLGMLRFQQGRYDEALDALSRSAQIDPKNPETQNYLGITLSQKGQREPAETALRKAIALNPNFAAAHHNLAVIYATQRPPFLELAKYHYNRARALGQPANPELEKQLGR